MRTRLIFASLFAATAITACSPAEDELAGEDMTELSDEKADATHTYTYYTVSRDMRRCASPFCGGYWVERVNRTTTKCADGTYAASCYVADADWARLGLEEQALDKVEGSATNKRLVVRATVVQKSWGADLGRLGQLRPTEAWIGQGLNEPDGVFVKIEETGVRCWAAPCPFFKEHKLNGSGTVSLAEVGWDDSGAADDVVGKAIEAIFAHDLIIAGDRYTVRGPAGTGKARTATQFYIRARDVEPTAP